MSYPLVPGDGPQLPALAEADAEVAAFVEASLAPATRATYESQWKLFVGWCLEVGVNPLPADPQDVARYLAVRARTVATATVASALQAIRHVHEAHGYPAPTHNPGIKRTLSGIRRAKGSRSEGSDPIRRVELWRALDAIEDTHRGRRDRALLLLGWAGALRRSEIVAADVDHLTFRSEGAVLLIPRSKTDQDGEGALIALHRGRDPRYCPVVALEMWLAGEAVNGHPVEGPLFLGIDRHGNRKGRLTAQSVNLLVKQRVAPFCARPEHVSAHGLRAGFITEAAELGVPDHRIQLHSRHRSREALSLYIRTAQLLFQPDMSRVVSG